MLYVETAADALVGCSIAGALSGHVINIGSGESITQVRPFKPRLTGLQSH